VFECVHCGAKLDVSMAQCPACGAEVEMGRLTGILGVVCRNCDAYNEPGARVCVSCGQQLASARPAPGPGPRAAPHAPGPPAAPPPPIPSSADLPPLELEPATPPARPPAAPKASPPSPQPPSFFGELDLDLPIRWTSPQGGPSASGPGDQTQPIAMVTACPSCGEEAGGGSWCVRCGQPLGGAHTRVLARPSAGPGQRTPSQVLGPAQPGKASLVLERGEGYDGAVFRLSGEEVGAGRSQGAILFPGDGSLAPLHATFLYREGRLHVRDEGSPGGTFVRLRDAAVPLAPGDLFAVGDRLLRYVGLLAPSPPPLADGTRRLGSPRPPGPAAVVEERLEGGTPGRVWLRPGPSVTLGRAGASINLGEDPYLSQAHAEVLLQTDGTASLRDLGSSNGTFVRLPPRGQQGLRDGDLVRMGREVLRVVAARV
jgi:hypothetical protein